jgi:serine/threonine-protein kinase HipA
VELSEVRAVEVRLWDRTVGAVAPLVGKPGIYEFEYHPEFAATGLALSPLMLPLAPRVRYSFAALDIDTYFGLPGLLADSLPDRFGNALINEYLVRHGIAAEQITTLQRLLYIGKRAMGALEFAPPISDSTGAAVVMPLTLATLVEDARRALQGQTSEVMQQIIDVGSSAGGARAKAVVGWNPTTKAVVSGQFELSPGFEHWILKFDVGEDKALGHTQGWGRIEYVHYQMATAAGITMSPCELLEENGRAHFMTRRFDRAGNDKLHLHSLCGIAHLDFNTPAVHSYEQYLRTILDLNLGAKALEQGWLRCVFNVAAVNCDDHTKNLAFLMDAAGRWSLAPAYDMCFAHNPAADRWTRRHQMLVRGKAWDIGAADLLSLADEFGIKRARVLLKRVVDAVRTWPALATDAGVPSAAITRIAGMQKDACSLL